MTDLRGRSVMPGQSYRNPAPQRRRREDMPYGEEAIDQGNRGELAERLRQQREQAQLSTEELATRLRITTEDMEAIERGDKPSPRQLVYAWLNACGMLGPERRAIMDLADNPAAR